jgi:hypothetical protein
MSREEIMTDERFNELLSGPLSHPLPMFSITRLVIALRAVIDATGEAGDKALEAHCAARQAEDEGIDDWDADEDGEGGRP